MYNVYFENRNSEKRLIGSNKDIDNCDEIILQFLREQNYTIPYWRNTLLENGIVVDVGIHSEFFYILKE